MVDDIYCLLEAFPDQLKEDLLVIINILDYSDSLQPFTFFKFHINGNVLSIPERIYYNEPPLYKSNSLSERQKLILHCLFTRHYDGYVREKNLKELLTMSKIDIWFLPYIIRLAGEYVVEILDLINTHINKLDKDIINAFISENLIFYNTIQSRIISYWNCYYRNKYTNKQDYVGYAIMNYLN